MRVVTIPNYFFAAALLVAWTIVLVEGIRLRRRARYIEELPFPVLDDPHLPRVSVVIAARNEEERIEHCLKSLLIQKKAAHEIIVVDDSSEDRTPEILARLKSQTGDLLFVLRIEGPPDGWLGKCHALQEGASRATGDYILFTDADVTFHPDVLAKVSGYAKEEGADFLCLFPRLELKTFGEKFFALGFTQLFFAAFRPHRAEAKRSRSFVGAGAFNMIRRSLYERVGGHSLLRLTVVDDVALGKLAKYSGAKVRILHSRDMVSVRWQKGLWGSIRGVEKNAFAGLRYSWIKAIGAVAAVLVLWWGPWICLIVPSDNISRCISAGAVIAQLTLGWGVCLGMGVSPFLCVLSPLAVATCAYALLRSAVLVTIQKGISWRGRFYHLRDLKKYDKL